MLHLTSQTKVNGLDSISSRPEVGPIDIDSPPIIEDSWDPRGLLVTISQADTMVFYANPALCDSVYRIWS
jgi:hypothetical protein